ncbi:hypothetical protein PILCRDRAFT_87618 [Piloderma croceum F 1598]|uniref:Uncharacterized protein n=1 Tax=Piloderma croceum (strain F 1598) TaxID=765440 RepID=A0A0C3BCX0_PILCF|nr:hypothetical protein PILCRDRAFT_87618 [Piloderma croceum F 1598]
MPGSQREAHVIPNNLDEFEILSDDRVQFIDSNLGSLTARGMWVEDAVPTPKLEVLILSDVVLRYEALRNFTANPMLQKIVADCNIENISRAANKIFCLSRLTHLGTIESSVRMIGFRRRPSRSMYMSKCRLREMCRISREGVAIWRKSFVASRLTQSGVVVTPFCRFLQETSSPKSLQLSSINDYRLDLVASVVKTLTHRLTCPLTLRRLLARIWESIQGFH